MSNVLKLPDSMQRQWRVYESGLENHMRQLGGSDEEIAHVLQNLKPVFLLYATQNLAVTVDTGNPEAAVIRLNEWVRGVVCGLLEEVAAREIRLFRMGCAE